MKIMKYKIHIVLLFIYLIFVQDVQSSIQVSALNKLKPKSSFLATSTKVSTYDRSLMEEMNSLLLRTEGPKRRKRYTDDGRVCSSAFVQDGQTYFDCTPTRSPDGQMKNKEWCYVDAKQKGEKTWDYCKPIMDYDKVREANQNELREITTAMRKAESEVSTQISPSQQALDKLKKTQAGQAEIDSKINKLIKDITTLNSNLESLYNIKEIWSKEEEKAVSAATQTDERKEKAHEEEPNNQPVKLDTSEDTLKKEMSSDKCVVNPFLQEKQKDNSFDCIGKLLYEEDANGDGLIGTYYDNEFFLGDYKERIDSLIDFEWTGSSPIAGLSPSNFSVKWEGYVLAPVSSNYVFAVESDGGSTVYVNGQEVIKHNMLNEDKENKSRVDKWFDAEYNKRINPSKNFQKASSIPIKLTGGSKYKISILYSHSIHNDIMDYDRSYFKLFWSSDDWEEAILPRAYLYSQNSFSPLKISGISSDKGMIRKLNENDLAFKNSEEYVIQDIPLDYKGTTSLKLNTKFMDKTLEFRVNIPVYVYIGVLDFYPNPLSNEFENTHEYMTLLYINKNSISSTSKVVMAENSGLVKIYRKKFDSGKVKIQLNNSSINAKGIPLIVFFGFDASIATPLTCGGDELLISKPGSPHFKTCSASSILENDYKCEYGLNDKNRDDKGKIWASKGEGVNSWIEVEFTGLYQITRIEYSNRRNPVERNQEIEVEFSNGNKEIMKLENVESVQTLKVDDIRATSIKFLVTKVYGTLNNGGSFRVYGVKCIDPTDDKPKDGFFKTAIKKVVGFFSKEIKPLFKYMDKTVISLNCKDSLVNNKNFNSIKKKAGNEVEVYCQENCASSPHSIYGDGVYSKDSVICKAAAHSDAVKSEGGRLKIIFEEGLKIYKSQSKNGIKSKFKNGSDLSIKFKSVQEEEEIILKNGNRVDYKDNNGKWQPAIIKKIAESKDTKVLHLNFEGGEPNKPPVEISYPNKSRIHPCGDHTKGRDCTKSRKNVPNNNPIKIRFAPKGEKSDGDFLWDRGSVFGEIGPFGWSKDMRNRVKIRNNASKPLLKYLAEFPPSTRSRWCSKPSPDVLCENVTWSVKVGIGKFSVKVYVGDPDDNTRMDLKINDINFIKGKTISKGDLQVFEGEFESVNMLLTLSSECDDDCEYSMARINMIEILPYKEATDSAEEEVETPEKLDVCGNGFTGGRCEKGPNVENCIFDDASSNGAKLCSGNLLLVQVPKQYKCLTQANKFKCVRRQFDSSDDCLKFCPGKCEKTICKA